MANSTYSRTAGSHSKENCRDAISVKSVTVTGTQTVEPSSPSIVAISSKEVVGVGGGGGVTTPSITVTPPLPPIKAISSVAFENN